MARYNPARYNPARYNMARYNMARYNMARYNTRPCGDFPWPDAAVEAVNCDYNYQHYNYPDVKGRCNVTCSDEDDLLVGPADLSYHGQYSQLSGTYVCSLANMTWLGEEPRCLGQYNSATVITNETTGTRLVGGEFYGCVELYDGVTGQWGPVKGWEISYWGTDHDKARMSWADLACRNLGFREGLATAGFRLANGVVRYRHTYYLQWRYRPSYPSTAPKFILSQSLPQWEGASLHVAIDRVVRGPCPDNDWDCRSDYDHMCLACAGERQHDDPQGM
ncbi:uncharacterized protein LOC118424035 [Branchiostoma floridae]|uniref:Uncharacterized protein LOC118424035 n=1 Tax=Branchiostoma floridae TaxID=7739 RepID=A0A9J7LTU7_BRAFL|nr:uncharacterized protein LOC118424035 [Branchiostoma floridae]